MPPENENLQKPESAQDSGKTGGKTSENIYAEPSARARERRTSNFAVMLAVIAVSLFGLSSMWASVSNAASQTAQVGNSSTPVLYSQDRPDDDASSNLKKLKIPLRGTDVVRRVFETLPDFTTLKNATQKPTKINEPDTFTEGNWLQNLTTRFNDDTLSNFKFENVPQTPKGANEINVWVEGNWLQYQATTFGVDTFSNSNANIDSDVEQQEVIEVSEGVAKLASDFSTIEYAIQMQARVEGLDTWKRGDSFPGLGTNPEIARIVETTSLKNYLLAAPEAPTGAGPYRYHNGGSTFTCGQNPARGVNIYISGISEDIKIELDEYLDGGDGPLCGKITYSENNLFYRISNNEKTRFGIRSETTAAALLAYDIVDDFQTIKKALKKWANAEGITSWRLDMTLLWSLNPTVSAIIEGSNLKQYLPEAPIPPIPGAYRYDNDGDVFVPGGNPNRGTNIYLEDVPEEVIAELDRIIDARDGGKEGKLTYNINTLTVYYKIGFNDKGVYAIGTAMGHRDAVVGQKVAEEELVQEVVESFKKGYDEGYTDGATERLRRIQQERNPNSKGKLMNFFADSSGPFQEINSSRLTASVMGNAVGGLLGSDVAAGKAGSMQGAAEARGYAKGFSDGKVGNSNQSSAMAAQYGSIAAELGLNAGAIQSAYNQGYIAATTAKKAQQQTVVTRSIVSTIVSPPTKKTVTPPTKKAVTPSTNTSNTSANSSSGSRGGYSLGGRGTMAHDDSGRAVGFGIFGARDVGFAGIPGGSSGTSGGGGNYGGGFSGGGGWGGSSGAGACGCL